MTEYPLTFLAGPDALSRIQREGLHPDMITAITAAAGGPKWLVVSGLDRALFPTWFEGRQQPLLLIGSSSGAWRMVCASQANPLAAITRFEAAYTYQRYPEIPPPHEISRQSRHIVSEVLGDSGIQEIFEHPYMRLHLLVVRSRGLTQFEHKIPQSIGLGGAAAANLISRRSLGLFFERVLFSHPKQDPPLDLPGFPFHNYALTADNFKDAVVASGSIPVIMSGVRDIAGAIPGVYRDGGVIDYHIDVALPGNGIVLFPHYVSHLTPGWLDKKLTWRKPEYSRNTLLVAPSKAFVESLPLKKIPDRDDFYLFEGRDEARWDYWQAVSQASSQLGEAFLEAVTSGKIRKLVQPLY
ncbi:MAG: hypothetical protein AAF485_06090 [Chloroflexota bacterium]